MCRQARQEEGSQGVDCVTLVVWRGPQPSWPHHNGVKGDGRGRGALMD